MYICQNNIVICKLKIALCKHNQVPDMPDKIYFPKNVSGLNWS